MPKENEKKATEKTIRLIWGSTADLPALFANHIQVSHAGGNEFHIFFGHATPPLTHGMEYDEIPDKIEVKTLTNIIVTPEMMKTIIEIFSSNYENYCKNFKKEG